MPDPMISLASLASSPSKSLCWRFKRNTTYYRKEWKLLGSKFIKKAVHFSKLYDFVLISHKLVLILPFSQKKKISCMWAQQAFKEPNKPFSSYIVSYKRLSEPNRTDLDSLSQKIRTQGTTKRSRKLKCRTKGVTSTLQHSASLQKSWSLSQCGQNYMASILLSL